MASIGPTSRQFAHRRESGKFIYKLFLCDKRLSPFHRSRPLLATMGGIPRKSLFPQSREKRYTDDYKCRGEWVNYLAGGSDSTARQFRIERSLRPRFRFPFRCGHNQKRLDNRELRNLFYRKREKDLWEKYSQTSFSLSHRCRIDTNRR